MPACASRSGGSGGGLGKAAVDDGGNVIGVGEPTSLDEVRQEGLDVVVVGFGPAQFRNQRTEGIGFNHGLRLVGGQAAALDESSPSGRVGKRRRWFRIRRRAE